MSLQLGFIKFVENQLTSMFIFDVDIHSRKISEILFGGKSICFSICRMSNYAPATSYVLNIKRHNVFYGCQVYTTRGSVIQASFALKINKERKKQIYKNMVKPCGRSVEQLVRQIDQER